MPKIRPLLKRIADTARNTYYSAIPDPLERYAAKSKNYPVYEDFNIPFIESKRRTLTNAGLATGAVISENLLDSIAKYANKAGLPLQTALGLVTKESTLGNPTDDATYNTLRKDDRSWKGTEQHINKGDTVWARNLVNYYKDYNNPYEASITYAKKKVLGFNRPFYAPRYWGTDIESYNEAVKEYNKQKAAIDSLLIRGEAYADKQARENRNKMNINILEAAFRDYKSNPNNYNPGQSNYPQLVNKRGKEVWNSPEIQSWYRRSLEDAGRPERLNGGIYIKPSKRGTFTAAATKHGMSVQGFASKVLANKEDYSPAMVKKANFAKNASKWNN